MKHYFECTCKSNEHIFCVAIEEGEDAFPPELRFHFQLSQPSSLLGRLWKAAKYILGSKCEYGHWDVVELSREDLVKLTQVLLDYKTKIDTYGVSVGA